MARASVSHSATPSWRSATYAALVRRSSLGRKLRRRTEWKQRACDQLQDDLSDCSWKGREKGATDFTRMRHRHVLLMQRSIPHDVTQVKQPLGSHATIRRSVSEPSPSCPAACSPEGVQEVVADLVVEVRQHAGLQRAGGLEGRVNGGGNAPLALHLGVDTWRRGRG